MHGWNLAKEEGLCFSVCLAHLRDDMWRSLSLCAGRREQACWKLTQENNIKDFGVKLQSDRLNGCRC